MNSCFFCAAHGRRPWAYHVSRFTAVSCVDSFVHSTSSSHRLLCRVQPIYYEVLCYYAVEHHHQQHTHACTLAGPATLLLRQRLRRVGGPRRRRARSSTKNQERSRLRPPRRGRGFFAKIGGERRLEGIGRNCVLTIAVVIAIGGGGEVRLDPGGRAQMAGRLREAVRAGRVNGEKAVWCVCFWDLVLQCVPCMYA